MDSLTFPTLLAAGLHPIDYGIVFFYMLCMLGMGWYLSRKQVTIEDFFVAGRKMPWLATGMSMIATLHMGRYLLWQKRHRMSDC